ncbi:MAG: dTMP kinase [Puniceicoccales bacterium]|jgi:dTMP kinase|nr:dTMP kinase [Puniceicoccales bacterium]
MSGIFVTFEGIEGCGKSTQLALLANWLRGNGREVVTTREPGGTEVGEKIRAILQAGNSGDVFSERTEILLFEASRAQHVREKIFPALKDNKIVLCDRFVDSTAVYQGAARGIGHDVVKFLNDFASHGRYPDMTVFLDISIAASFGRIAARSNGRDRIEQEDERFFKRVRNHYLKLASENARFFTVAGTATVEAIHEKIRNEFAGKFFKN